MCRKFLHRESCFRWPKKVNTCWFSGNPNKNTEVYLYSGGQNEFQNDSAQIHNQPNFPLVPPLGITTLSNPFLRNPLLQVSWNSFSLLPVNTRRASLLGSQKLGPQPMDEISRLRPQKMWLKRKIFIASYSVLSLLTSLNHLKNVYYFTLFWT